MIDMIIRETSMSSNIVLDYEIFEVSIKFTYILTDHNCRKKQKINYNLLIPLWSNCFKKYFYLASPYLT